ncbi:MAG: FAD-binding oxidoreductase [Parvularculaceae bacterium]
MNRPPLVATDRWRSWGRVVRAEHAVVAPRHRDEIRAALECATEERSHALAVGLGRSYGDSGLNPGGALIDMRGVDRLIAFDAATGILRAEAGASLWDILAFAIPRGYFLPTTPGTRFVTLAGAIANDVHGKNHHRAGSFGRFVRRIGLLRSDEGVLDIGPNYETALFNATIGGLGLTGIILWAEIALAPIRSSRIEQETIPFGSIDEFFNLAAESAQTWEHTVAWVDCLAAGKNLGRGNFTRGNWAASGPLEVRRARRGPSIPIDAPTFLLNRVTLRAFNEAYWRAQRLGAGKSNVAYDTCFYPLDAIGDWNRLYGRLGFYQYQSVVPPNAEREATRAMLEAIAAAGQGSFLAVLKTFGPLESPGLLSFPMEGVTLALDFPNRGQKTLDLLARLDAIVAEAGGRLYPAKDGRLPAAMFRKGYSAAEAFAKHVDPKLSSGFWTRMSEG